MHSPLPRFSDDDDDGGGGGGGDDDDDDNNNNNGGGGDDDNNNNNSHKSKVTISWNQQVQTDSIPNNKVGIINCDNNQGTYTLIDDAIPGDRNVIKKEQR